MMIFNKKQRKLSSRRIKKLGVLFFTAVFVFTVFVMAVPVSAEGSTIQVSYVNRYWNGEKVVSSTEKANCSVITANTTDLQNGWYVVDSDLTIKCRIEVSGTVNLVLRDGKTLNVVGGLHLKDGVVLNVYGQSNDSGLLNATEPGSNKAAIGGNKNQSGRTINVYGGKINAVAGKYAAAIGGGYEGRGPTFTIYGGSVIAEAEKDVIQPRADQPKRDREKQKIQDEIMGQILPPRFFGGNQVSDHDRGHDQQCVPADAGKGDPIEHRS